MNDYYQILGVDRDASPEQIKKAYRRLARELHPDVATGDGSGDRFKDVTRAYEVLGNPEKRRTYDSGSDPSAPNGGAGAGGSFGFQDIFETFFGASQGASAQRGPIPRARRGQDALVRLDLDLVDAVFGAHHELQVDTAVVCATCAGSCCRPGTSPRTCDVCGGRGVVQRVARSFLGQVMTSSPCAACHGFDGRALNWGTDKEPAYIGTEANSFPHEVLHKIRNAHPGAAMINLRGFPLKDAIDVLAFARSLPPK